MKHIEVKLSTYIGVDIKVTDKDPKLEVSDHVRLSRFKNIFAKDCIPRWHEEFFVIEKVKNTVLGIYVKVVRNGREIIGTFHKKELQKGKSNRL